MIARIVPSKRTPRNLSVFDYLVPPELEHVVQPGQLVVIELKKTKEFGIILELFKEQDATFAYKSLDSIVHTIPLIPPSNQKFLSTISSLYATSLATIYKTSLLPLQKRKITKIALSELPPENTSTHFTESYFLYRSPEEREQLFSPLQIATTSLVLVPEVGLLEPTQKIIEKQCETETIIWHSDLSDKEKFDRWIRVRTATTPLVVIGTRSALTLPFTQLDSIVVDEEHSEQYKSYDQQPKYHARDMATELGRIYQATCVYSSFSPSFEMYYRIAKEQLPCKTAEHTYTSGLLFTAQKTNERTRIIEHIPQPQDKRVCSITTEEKILEIGRGCTSDAIILVQRKGFATLVVCKDCGHIETSQETGLPMMFRKDTGKMHATHGHEERPLPASCSVCKSTILLLQGIGTEKIASYISELFAKEKISMPVLRIDDNTEEKVLEQLAVSDNPRILVGTEKVLSYIRPHQTQLYALLDLDRSLALPEYNAFEHTVHLIQKLEYLKNPEAELLIETTSAEKPIFRLFSEADRVYRSELGIRKKLELPPYRHMVKYSIGSPNSFGAKKNAQNFIHLLKLKLTEHKISAMISEIYDAYPSFQKGMYWNNVLIKTDITNLRRISQYVHPYIPHGCIVDHNPLSTLSP